MAVPRTYVACGDVGWKNAVCPAMAVFSRQGVSSYKVLRTLWTNSLRHAAGVLPMRFFLSLAGMAVPRTYVAKGDVGWKNAVCRAMAVFSRQGASSAQVHRTLGKFF